MTRSLPLSAALILLSGMASAQSLDGTVLGSGLSSMGAYGSLSHELRPGLRLRGVLTGLPGYSFDEEEEGIDYEVDASIGGVAALADYYPMNGGLRLSGGIFFGGGEIEGRATARGSETIEVNGTDYRDASIETDLSFEEEIAPMLAIGYERRIGARWAFEAEIGAIAIGGVRVDAEGRNVPQQDIEAEAQEIEDDLSGFKAYPWLAIGVNYAF